MHFIHFKNKLHYISVDFNISWSELQLHAVRIDIPWIQRCVITSSWLNVKRKKGEFAQFGLGKMYADSDYVIPDYKLAIKWLEKSVKQGAYFSYFVIGYHYNYGKNFPLNKKTRWNGIVRQQCWGALRKKYSVMPVCTVMGFPKIPRWGWRGIVKRLNVAGWSAKSCCWYVSAKRRDIAELPTSALLVYQSRANRAVATISANSRP